MILSQEDILKQITQICAVVNSVVDNKELLEVSLKQTLELFGADRGSIFILKENGRDLILKTAHGMDKDEENRLVKRMGEGVVGQVAELKEPIFVDDIHNDARFSRIAAQRNYKTASFICAPLMVKDHLIGVINITDKTSGHRFKKSDLQILDFLSTQIALNYRRIELYHKFKSVLKETQNLKNKIEVQEKLASIGKLAGGIAHEFNNPLDGVIRYTNLCLEQANDNEVLHGYLLEIKHGLNRMANIVRNLLDCSRSQPSGQQRVSVEHALEATLSNLKHELSAKSIIIEKDVHELPVIADFGMETVFSNLIRNAIDILPRGGKISINAQKKGNYIEISVQDNGPGIEQENLDKIFEPFFTTKDIDKGCGLGLTVVLEIVKSYQGKIDVSSELGRGTRFHLQIPVKV